MNPLKTNVKFFIASAQARIMSAGAFLHLSRASQREVFMGSALIIISRPIAPASVVQDLKRICKPTVVNNCANKVLLKSKKFTSSEG